MNKIIYGAFTFSDADLTLIEGGKASLYYSPLGDELRAAEYSIPIKYVPRDWSLPAMDFKEFTYGDPVDIYEDSTLLRRFYLTDIVSGQRLTEGAYVFYLTGVDFIGLYAAVPHAGGIYSNTDAGDIIAEIIGATEQSRDLSNVTYETADGIEFTVDLATATSRVDGWLPATEDARANLRSVLQLLNASPQQNADGSPHFGPMDHGAELTISPYDTYQGDAYETQAAVTKVQVVEYEYYQLGSAEEELLYDASSLGANGFRVSFDGPKFDLRGDGLTIDSSGANFAVVTGTGQLYGKPYTVSARVLQEATGLSGAENVRTIDNTLCSSLYSYNILVRMVRYFGHASIVDNAVAMPTDFGPGQALAYSDPMFESKHGYPTEMQLLYSGITKSTNKITADWIPADETPYTVSQLITTSGTWTPPNGATRLRFVLIGGGSGGWGGYKGEHGGDHNTVYGAGGEPGEGGQGGKVFQLNVEYDDMAPSYDIVIGSGGSAGAIDHGQGSDGGDTTLDDGQTVYSSASGIRYQYGVTDVLTGDIYASEGDTGVYRGGDGTGYAHPAQSVNDSETTQTGVVTTWNGGADYVPSLQGGGGAAYGNNGGDASPGHRGGNGADAVLDGFGDYVVGQPAFAGQGGLGGNGGGGGGCGGNGDVPALGDGVGGDGGHGSVGGDGADGAVLVLIAYGTPPTPILEDWLFDADGEQLYDSNYEPLKEA